MMGKFSDFLFPLFFCSVLLLSLIRKKDTVSAFLQGARDGISAIVSVTPNILAVMVASALFREGGAMNWFLHYLAPVFRILHIPAGIAELVLLRPISGSGATALLSEVYRQFGPDSREGLLASLIAASTETTLYTLMVYFGVTRIRKTTLPLAIGLISDVFVVLIAGVVVSLL